MLASSHGAEDNPNPIRSNYNHKVKAITKLLFETLTHVNSGVGERGTKQITQLVEAASKLAMEIGIQRSRMQLYNFAGGKPVTAAAPPGLLTDCNARTRLINLSVRFS